MKKLTLTGLLLGLSSAISFAQLINFDYNGARGTNTGAAVIGSAGDIWNGINGTVWGGLLDASGAATGIRFYQDGGMGMHAYGTASGPNDEMMLDYGYLRDDDPHPDTNAVKRFTLNAVGLTELNPDQEWDIYIYSGGDRVDQGAQWTLTQDGGDITKNASGGGWSGSFVEGGNYVLFSGVSPTLWSGGANAEFEIHMEVIEGSSESGASKYGAFNGLQMVLIPEPTTFALLGLGGLMLVARRRLKV